MFFTDFIKRRLASLLQPWLQQELELELQLGFLRSHAIAKDLSFDTSALNKLLDDCTPISFKEVRVERLILRVSYCAVPAFTFEVHGLHFTLSVGYATSLSLFLYKCMHLYTIYKAKSHFNSSAAWSNVRLFDFQFYLCNFIFHKKLLQCQ